MLLARRALRVLLAFGYACMGGSSVLTFFIPLATFSLAGWRLWLVIWAICLTVGGGVGAIGALRRSLTGELTAITLLVTGYCAYILLLVTRLVMGAPKVSAVGSLFVLGTILALTLLLLRRYAELWIIVRQPRTPPKRHP